jgi:tRNA-splicing ligase RtcB
MEIIETTNVPIKAWIEGVGVEDKAKQQLINTASLPIIFHHVAVMPDVHFGMGATVGSVVPTEGAIIPAAVGVDIGCGMIAVQTDLPAVQLPDSLARLRSKIEQAVPHGRSANGGKRDRGAWS